MAVITTKAIFQRYVDGEMTSEEMGRAIDELLDRKIWTRTFARAQVRTSLVP